MINPLSRVKRSTILSGRLRQAPCCSDAILSVQNAANIELDLLIECFHDPAIIAPLRRVVQTASMAQALSLGGLLPIKQATA
jgi:hypothetical protein